MREEDWRCNKKIGAKVKMIENHMVLYTDDGFNDYWGDDDCLDDDWFDEPDTYVDEDEE
jgi:hypothetical protein